MIDQDTVGQADTVLVEMRETLARSEAAGRFARVIIDQKTFRAWLDRLDSLGAVAHEASEGFPFD